MDLFVRLAFNLIWNVWQDLSFWSPGNIVIQIFRSVGGFGFLRVKPFPLKIIFGRIFCFFRVKGNILLLHLHNFRLLHLHYLSLLHLVTLLGHYPWISGIYRWTYSLRNVRLKIFSRNYFYVERLSRNHLIRRVISICLDRLILIYIDRIVHRIHSWFRGH